MWQEILLIMKMFINKIILLLSLFFSLITNVNAQKFTIRQGNYIPIDFNTYQRKNFKFLDSLLLNNETILLGEGLHRYSYDTKTKLQIIKYLHEELGYNLILLEYSFYDFWDLNKSLGVQSGFDDTLDKYCNFRFSKGIYDIIKYVNDCKLKGDTFNIGGIDIWTTYNNEFRHFLWFITENEKQINPNYADLFTINGGKRLELETITSLQDSVVYNLFDSVDLNKLWTEIYNNFKIAYKYNEEINIYYKNHPNVTVMDSNIVSDNFKRRDSMMFANYLFLSEKFNTKSIILASNFHVRKEVKPFLSNPGVGNNTIPFGGYFSKYHINSFHIASISYKVEEFTKQNIYRKYFHRDKKSLEKFLYKKYQQNGFIELKNIELNGDSTFIMYPIWRFETKGNWQKAFDAVIYLNEINLPKSIKACPVLVYPEAHK